MNKNIFLHGMSIGLRVGNIELIYRQKPNKIKHGLIVPEIRA